MPVWETELTARYFMHCREGFSRLQILLAPKPPSYQAGGLNRSKAGSELPGFEYRSIPNTSGFALSQVNSKRGFIVRLLSSTPGLRTGALI